jgi:hypothetical protein
MPELDEEQIKRRAGEFELESVHTLQLASMGLRSITAIASCPGLTELDVSDNALSSLDALSSLAQLKRLIVSTNKVQRLEPLRGLEALHTLRLDANAVSNLDEVHHLAQLPSLQVIYFRKVYEQIAGPNPICSHPAYRPTVLRLLTQLRNLDGERIRSDGAVNKLVYETEPNDGGELPPLPVPQIEPVFKPEELSAFHAHLAATSEMDPALTKQIDSLLHDSKRLVAKANSLVRNYCLPADAAESGRR